MRHAPSDYAAALRALGLPVIGLACITNLTILVSPLFMMQVLDRVLPSGNLATLALLGLLAAGVLMVNAVIEVQRDRILGRAGNWFEANASTAVFSGNGREIGEGLEQIAGIRDVLRRGVATTMADLPWLLLFAVAIALIHPYFLILLVSGLLALGAVRGADTLLATHYRAQSHGARTDATRSLSILEAQGPSGRLMGLSESLTERYRTRVSAALDADAVVQRHEAVIGAIGRFLRTAIQTGTLGLGALLVIAGDLTAGGMIGASIVLGKTIATAEQVMVVWPQWRAGLASARALSDRADIPDAFETKVADLSGALSVRNLTMPRGAGAPPRLERLSFTLSAGECLAIFGASGSGKSSLLSAMAGIENAPIGNVFLDETDVLTLAASTRRTAIGYLPQLVRMTHGTIAENIASFASEREDAMVL
ncbi:MAG: ATP-binding cassette domain-containing protein, partial [Shimia sp.]